MLIWRWKGYPQFLTQMSRSCIAVSHVIRRNRVWPYVEREQGHVLVAVVHIVDNGHGCFARSAGCCQPMSLS